ncbi:MAG: efflux RND transporter permease subunit [Candidatus Schekmanbacteria bacterium]|nr:efflux RND transporter permease subunit [Candidatus Schekmanbacteria bacterium]
MTGLVRAAIHRPVATSMVYLGLIVVGLVSLRSLPVDLLPKIELTQLTVRTTYANVGPEEIEQLITDPIENAVSGLPNLERVTSESEEGRSRVRLEFGRGTDIDEAANDVRAALDLIRDDLPEEADAPEILKLDLDRVEVVNLGATSTRPLAELTRLLENDVARQLGQISGVGAITLRGAIHREVHVDLQRDRLAAAGTSALAVRDALAAANLRLPGGNVKSGLADLYVRAQSEFRSVREIAETVVSSADGRPLRVQDVGTVAEAFVDEGYLAEINGVPAVIMRIQKQSGANTVAVAERILAEVERLNDERADLHLTVLTDQSDYIRQSIASLRSSALWGSVLAILVLYAFLRRRSSTAIIAVSIPISVISAFGLLYFGGLTLNQMTFGGLALGVGMIVDSAIVVLESIVRKRDELQLAPAEAARQGAQEVAGAIVASTLTTCVIFLPVVFARTTSGALFQVLALVVVFALACSLLVALTLVPMACARLAVGGAGSVADNGGGPASPRLMARLEQGYVRRLRWVLRHRGHALGIAVALLVASVFLWPLIPVELAPQTDANEVAINVDMAQGTNIAVVRSAIDELEAKVKPLLSPTDVHVMSTEVRGSNAQIELTLVPADRRSLSGQAVAARLREALVGRMPGGEIQVRARPGLWILRRIFGSGGNDDAIQIELRGWDLERADEIASALRERLGQLQELTGVQVSRREGQPEERLMLDRERIAAAGLSVREVAQAFQAYLGGVVASRFRDGADEIPIVVRLRAADRLASQDLQAVPLRVGESGTLPLSAVVSRVAGRTPTSVSRVDGQRVTYVTAGLAPGVALGSAIERIREALRDFPLPDDFSLTYGGEYREQLTARRDFVVAIIMALALVYMLMAGQFERLLDPLIVMTTVPMALIGVVPTLLLTGTTLNIQSVMGLVILVGIVVNNAIVLVDAINLQRRAHGKAVAEAVVEAGRLRLRPILMTTSTTVLALLPLGLGLGPGAEIQAPLARVVIGGLCASTLGTLVLIPVIYEATMHLMARRGAPGARAAGDKEARPAAALVRAAAAGD